jgi:hypothetical protein
MCHPVYNRLSVKSGNALSSSMIAAFIMTARVAGCAHAASFPIPVRFSEGIVQAVLAAMPEDKTQ